MRLEVRRSSSISDWELLQRPDDCPSGDPQEDGDMCPGSSSSRASPPSPPSTRADPAIARPCELSGGVVAASQQSEYKPPKGELSPSFINPSPRQVSSEDSEEDEGDEGDGGHVQEGEEDLQEQQCVKKRAHVHKRQHAKHPSVGVATLLAREETPPTSASESLPSHSDSDVPPETEECPSITPEGNLDSDEDAEHLPVDKLSASGAGPGHRPPSPRPSARSPDPLPAPVKDCHPHPPQPDVCMVDPEVVLSDQSSEKMKKELKSSRGPRKSKSKGGSPATRGEARTRSWTPLKHPSKEPATPRRKDGDRSSRPTKTSEAKTLVNGVKNAPGGFWSEGLQAPAPPAGSLAGSTNPKVQPGFHRNVRQPWFPFQVTAARR